LTHFCQGRDWAHFRNADGLVLSCRTWSDKYPDYTPFVEAKGGHRLVLTESVVDAAKHAEIFSRENCDENQLKIELSRGKLVVFGRGVSGESNIISTVEYQGPPTRFYISPSLLVAIQKMADDDTNCVIKPGLMSVQGKGWTYAACLGEVADESSSKSRKRPR
jgi:hypothetical protein